MSARLRFTVPDARARASGKFPPVNVFLDDNAVIVDLNPAGFRRVAAGFECGPYAVSVDLPEMADPATLKAALANGILSVAVAKRPETQARRIEIG